MAQRILQRRRRGVDGERGARPGPREDRGCATRCHASAGAPIANRTNWTIPRLITEIEAREGSGLADHNCPRRCEKKLPLAAAPAHAERPPERRRDRARGACAFSCARPRPRLATSFSFMRGERGPDTSSSGPLPYLSRASAKRGANLRAPVPGQAKKVAMIGSLNHVTRRLIVHTSATKRSSDFIAHPDG